jgi:hypothetical protein
MTVKSIAYALTAALLASSAYAADPIFYDPFTDVAAFNDHDKEVLAWRLGLGEYELPPLEYDHPYPGKLRLVEVGDQEELMSHCPRAKKPAPSSVMLGCTNIGSEYCTIYHAPKQDIERYGGTLNMTLRHEIAHCNGWPGDHPAAQ